ncbi:ABC transporter ATP-binding protein [Mesorhizobium sp. M7A.F.Ca.US.006.01.1.1]|uniref:ABC transporter ATP-binding protein n=1 Tax=Mesorhizobium sp. M7A.F.Ca.US.006.01.1.1 TaxID=2496707 RepID=UPI000FCAE4D2|nr:ABC transporter ATP-binding protein [Mesorhizobium sp. M7A.F.Ca.US.006.01.1.1]RUZ71009.1 ABC transporter ATP-binding protein [Mesorhizobium sp. M7A.F.Ca.US.006.01.1.1]
MTRKRTLLSAEKVAVRFGGLTAIDDLSFHVHEGEVVSLIGPNGAGKTTAFNVVSGFLAPAEGTVRFAGEPLTGLKPHQIANLGLVRTFQRTSLFNGATVFESVLRALHRKGSANAWSVLLGLPSVAAEELMLRTEAEKLLQFVGLLDGRERHAGSLSYGEQRLLGLAMAMAADPKMLLLDEPVSGMNATETSRFMAMLETIRKRGVTILLVEHDMRMVMEVSDRVLVLYQGHIIANGVPAEIRQNPEVISAYLGHGKYHAGN